MSRRSVRLLVVLASLLGAMPASAQLCAPAADPCVVSAATNVAGGSVIDLGDRDLVIGPAVTVTVLGTGTGGLSISARNVTFEDGARLIAGGVDGSGGAVALAASGTLLMLADSRIDVVGGSGGDVTVVAADALLQGQIRANGTNSLGDGGFVDVTTSGALTLGGGGILANGGNGDSFGGFVFLSAGGAIEIGAQVEAHGGSGGDSDFDAGGDLSILSTGIVNNIALFAGNDGGDVSFAAGGTVSIAGPVWSRGQGSLNEGGGFGGDFDILAAAVVIDAQIELTGAGPDGDGGFLDISADQDILVRAPILATGAGQGGGGEVDLFTRGRVDVQSPIDLRGGFVGGVFDVQTAGAVAFTSAARIYADFIPGFAFGGYGGIVLVDGCDITVPFGATLTAEGIGVSPRATVRLRAGNAMTIGGTLQAGTGVTLHHRGPAPTILGSAVIQPAPTIIADPNLPCCVSCETTTTTSTSSSSTSSSTTTSIPTSSTTTSTVVASTTSSSSSTTSSSTSSTTSTSVSTTTSSSTSTTSTVASTSTSTTAATSSSTSTTTSSSTSSSTSVPSTTSTSTTTASSTTSTTLPLTCLDEPLEGYAAVECAVGELSGALASHPADALGGAKSARGLARKIVKIELLVERSRNARRPDKLLIRAQRKVRSFEIQLARLLAKNKIDDLLVEELLALSSEVTLRIDGLTPAPA